MPARRLSLCFPARFGIICGRLGRCSILPVSLPAAVRMRDGLSQNRSASPRNTWPRVRDHVVLTCSGVLAQFGKGFASAIELKDSSLDALEGRPERRCEICGAGFQEISDLAFEC